MSETFFDEMIIDFNELPKYKIDPKMLAHGIRAFPLQLQQTYNENFRVYSLPDIGLFWINDKGDRFIHPFSRLFSLKDILELLNVNEDDFLQQYILHVKTINDPMITLANDCTGTNESNNNNGDDVA